MEEDRSRSARLIGCVIAGIVGSLIPAGYITFVDLIFLGVMEWEAIISITASGALGGSLAWLIFRKYCQIEAGIFGFVAGVITLLYMINCL